jgi:hypothetical protein
MGNRKPTALSDGTQNRGVDHRLGYLGLIRTPKQMSKIAARLMTLSYTAIRGKQQEYCDAKTSWW